MSSDYPRQFLIEIQSAGPPVSGQWQPQGMPARAFTGWTELFAGLDAAVTDRGGPSETEPGSEPAPR